MYTRIEEPTAGPGRPPTTAQEDAVARAMAASRRLIDAATKAGTACVEACQESVEVAQETVLGIPGFDENIAAAASPGWSKLLAPAGYPGSGPVGEQWRKALDGVVQADDLVAAAKQVYREWVDSYEQAVLAAIDLRERVGEATNLDWIQSVTSTRAGAARDITRAYVKSLRVLLK